MRTWNPAFDGPPSEEAVRLSREWPFESVLDVGCGSGRNLLPYAGRGALLVGFDLDESAVRAARTRVGRQNPRSLLFVGDARARTLSAAFDIVLCYGVLHFLPRADRARAYEHLRSWTRPGGIASLVAFNAAVPVPADLADLIPEPAADSAELREAFGDWKTVGLRSYVYEDEHEGGRIRHRHSIDRLIVRRPPST